MDICCKFCGKILHTIGALERISSDKEIYVEACPCQTNLVDAQDRHTDAVKAHTEMEREAESLRLEMQWKQLEKPDPNDELTDATLERMEISGLRTRIKAFRKGPSEEKDEQLSPLPLVEIVHEHDDSVHYRRPWGHPDVAEAVVTHGYYIRPEGMQADG